MSYEHVAILPFLIDDAHLTPEEVAERADSPIAWASRRYAQPEHVFRAAAERHGWHSTNTVLSLSPTGYPDCRTASSSQATNQSESPASGPSLLPSAQLRQDWDTASFQPQRAAPAPTATSPAGPSTPSSSSASFYFSTVLSSYSWPKGMDIEARASSPENRDGGQSPLPSPHTHRAGREGHSRAEQVSSKDKRKIRTSDSRL